MRHRWVQAAGSWIGFDILGQIVYASNHSMAYSYFGRDIPWFRVLGYLPWVGLLPYLIARAMSDGVPRRRLHMLAVGSFVSVVIVESLGNALDAWTNYGDAPLKYLVVAPQMAPVPIVGGYLLLADSLSGWTRVLAAFVISTVALPMVFASASWPLYVGLNADLPAFMDWLMGGAMLALTGFTVLAATQLAQNHWRVRKLELSGCRAESRSVHTPGEDVPAPDPQCRPAPPGSRRVDTT